MHPDLMPRVSEITPLINLDIGNVMISKPKFNLINDANFKSIIREFKNIDNDMNQEDQYHEIISISLKYSICWDSIIELIDAGILQYDDDTLNIIVGDDINLLKISDFQT